MSISRLGLSLGLGGGTTATSSGGGELLDGIIQTESGDSLQVEAGDFLAFD